MAQAWWRARAPVRCSTRILTAAKVSTPPQRLVIEARGPKTIRHSLRKPVRTPTVTRSTTRLARLRVEEIR